MHWSDRVGRRVKLRDMHILLAVAKLLAGERMTSGKRPHHRLCAQSTPNPAMHITSTANTTTFSIASIIFPLHQSVGKSQSGPKKIPKIS
jgi:hypothetical protein